MVRLYFTVYPTRMDRVAENLLNDNPGVLNQALQWIYNMDGGRYGTNLAPSYHCLISTCCYMGVANALSMQSPIESSLQYSAY